MISHEVGLAPTPMPQSVVTGSQTHPQGDETDEGLFSEMLQEPTQSHNETTDDIHFTETNLESSHTRGAESQRQAGGGAGSEQLYTQQTPERTRQTDGETEEVQFFTEATQDWHTQTESEQRALPPDMARALDAAEAQEAAAAGHPHHTPSPLNNTARPIVPPTQPSTTTGTPSFHIEEDNSEMAAQEAEMMDDHYSAAHVRTQAKLAALAPPIPRTRGPGHTPRGATPDSSRPPHRPPSRTSSRFGTPRVSRGADAPGAGAEAAGAGGSLIPERAASRVMPVRRQSTALSDRSITFHIDEDPTDTTSLMFQVEPSVKERRATDASVDPATNTETSEIHFDVEESRGSRLPTMVDRGNAGTASMTSLQFDIDSTADQTHQSSISHFSIENDEPEPLVPSSQQQQPMEITHDDEEDDEAEAAPEVLTESEERRREKKAEEDRRKKALADRSTYMNTRPWDTNAPSARKRRTSSQAVARNHKLEAEKQKQEAEKRHHDMYARPWRTGMTTTPKKKPVEEKKPMNERAWRTNMATTPKRQPPPEPPKAVNQRPWRTGMPTTPKKKRAKRSDSPADDWRQQLSRNNNAAAAASSSSSSASTSPASSVEAARRYAPRATAPLVPAKPVFDERKAALFITPAPVLKTPLQVVAEEVEGWSETVSQQRSLQALLETMRVRERACVQLSNQLEAQTSAIKHLNKELYTIRDAYVRKHGSDVTGMPLHPRKAPTPEKSPERENGSPAEGGGGIAVVGTEPELTKEEYMLLRLYPRQDHKATDYYAQKQQNMRGRNVSVLSDEEMSDGEKADFADEIEKWRVERLALRKRRARLAHDRRDLSFQMRRGTNIKEVKSVQPTSARGPLERRAAGFETAADIDGYDKLTSLRIAARKAAVEAASAEDQYGGLTVIAATMRKQQNNNSREYTDAEELQEEAKARYKTAVQTMRQRVEEARPVVEQAKATMGRRQREAMRSDEENAHSELREYSDAILALRLQTERCAAIVGSAGADEERMRRASTPRITAGSRTASPRGSMGAGATPRNGAAKTDDVFARLTSRPSYEPSSTAPKRSSMAPKSPRTASKARSGAAAPEVPRAAPEAMEAAPAAAPEAIEAAPETYEEAPEAAYEEAQAVEAAPEAIEQEPEAEEEEAPEAHEEPASEAVEEESEYVELEHEGAEAEPDTLEEELPATQAASETSELMFQTSGAPSYTEA